MSSFPTTVLDVCVCVCVCQCVFVRVWGGRIKFGTSYHKNTVLLSTTVKALLGITAELCSLITVMLDPGGDRNTGVGL